MSRMAQRRGILIIGDTWAFGRVVRAMLEQQTKLSEQIRETTYEDCHGLLTPRALRETALFVVELWRSYPTGLRAEGIAVAEQLIRLGANALIVSPLSLNAGTPNCYWDISSTDKLVSRIDRLLRQPVNGIPINGRNQIENVKKLLADYSARPTGHDDNR